ncbi:superoxide dismutase [Gammaproteobacteria bacterium SCGC AG-212-F23]|nr:superoxide dismutase [Gammaproteobacteria bacterium SCGC AG-212-F23]
MKGFLKIFCFCISLFAASNIYAATTVTMYITAEKSPGTPVGTIEITETPYGLLFTPHLHGLTPGIHGFHVHQNPSCEKSGMAAGGHLDPKHTDKHLGPYNDKGHLGDLPAIYVEADGSANVPVLAPRLKHVAAIQHHSLMLHAGGDNYSDAPQKLGGGGSRMVCGVVG